MSMNRAERRKKHKPTPTFNRMGAWAAINVMMIKNSADDQDDEAHRLLMMRAYTALSGLTGTSTSAPWIDCNGFIDLNEMNCFAFCLAKRLHDYGTEQTRKIIEPCSEVMTTAADALADIGLRFAAKGVYRATGDELQAIRASFDWLDNLLAVSTQGHTLKALIEASAMVESQLHRERKRRGVA